MANDQIADESREPPEKNDPVAGPGSDVAALCRITMCDYLIAALILIVSIGVLIPSAKSVPNGKLTALVTADGVPAREIDLSIDSLISCTGATGKLDLEVKSGRIRVFHANCPHGQCRQAGWISRPGETLICLPNRVLIDIEGESGITNAYDAITH